MSDSTVIVREIPPCEFHPDRSARYDARTKDGPWAYLCRACFKTRGVGLGFGRGQYLVLELQTGGVQLDYEIHPYYVADVAELLRSVVEQVRRTDPEDFWLEWVSDRSDLGWVGCTVNHLGWLTVDHWDGDGVLVSTEQLDGWEEIRRFTEAVLGWPQEPPRGVGWGSLGGS